jgi:hypothetical protein
MARSKSKHIRIIMQRRKHWKQRTKRIKEAIKANGGKPLPRKAAHVKKKPPLPPPPRAPEASAAGQSSPAPASTAQA